MLIVPVENKPDWRHPPLVTLALIVCNVWLYVALADADRHAYERAVQTYVARGLVQFEATLYRAYAGRSRADTPLPDEDHQLIPLIVGDLGFDAVVAAEIDAAPEWRDGRRAFLRARDQVRWLQWSLVPRDSRWLTYLTAMFLHGGLDHLLGNMAFLFLFGFALERLLGSASFAAVYLLGGLAGGALHVLVHPDSSVPTIGASGAVSALMGAYLAVYRLRRIRFFYSVLVYFGAFRAPALMVLPLWLGKELYGYLYGHQGIAYWDHIGGLVAGAGLGYAATLLSGRVDEEYLETGTRAAKARDTLGQLDVLIDDFKFDRARTVAAQHLRAHPGDASVWRKYFDLIGNDGADPEYHRAVAALLALAARPAAVPDDLRRVMESTFESYLAGSHARPAVGDPKLLCQLGKLFVRGRRLDLARKIANGLLQANRREPAVADLLEELCRALVRAGAGQLGARYRAELNARFPDPEPE